ncbi:hypothetical protein SAMN04244579_02687 [Azotobacter beijerinckii]|uniref:Uncharacterized protein n=1 Tax=Azotobacter beijerinckii TaxID=170623 RepID=A0A1H6V185_9GAMM|nr:hypothetical protein [Azotobacter beijerinckii]SEI98339.1 hypothetical protein SAMN04244579_02687 [Azotobacter beijerinckii]
MEQDKVRAEFEAAMNAEAEAGGYEVDWSRSEVDAERYANPAVRSAWWAWQASREAVVVELPEPVPFRSREDTIQDCRAAIHAAGIRTK